MPTEVRNLSLNMAGAMEYKNPGAVNPVVSKTSYVCQITDTTRTSVVSVGWRRRPTSELIGYNPFSFSKLTYNPKPIGNYYSWSGFNYVNKNDRSWTKESGPVTSLGSYLSGFGSPPPSQISAAEITALNHDIDSKLLRKLKDESVNLAVLTAERGQTIRMLSDTVQRTAKAVIALKKGNFVSACDALGVLPRKRAHRRFNRQVRDARSGKWIPKFGDSRVRAQPEIIVDTAEMQQRAIANGWLELQYGWKPLFSDLYGACDALSRRYANQTKFKVARASATRKITLDTSTPVTGGVQRNCIVQSYTVKKQVRYSVTTSSLSTMGQLGITNPLLLAWELVPFSFVVDWFLPVGNFLGTLDATIGLTFQAGFTTVFDKRSQAVTRRYTTGSPYTSGQSVDVTQTSDCVYCTRTLLGSFPTPHIPTFRNPLSAGHVANGLALLTQLFKR